MAAKPPDRVLRSPLCLQAYGLVARLPVRAIAGVGWKTEQVLTTQLGVQLVRDLRTVPAEVLAQHLGVRQAQLLSQLCQGLDPSPVVPKGPPKSITVEDSFKSCEVCFPANTTVCDRIPPQMGGWLHHTPDVCGGRSGAPCPGS